MVIKVELEDQCIQSPKSTVVYNVKIYVMYLYKCAFHTDTHPCPQTGRTRSQPNTNLSSLLLMCHQTMCSPLSQLPYGFAFQSTFSKHSTACQQRNQFVEQFTGLPQAVHVNIANSKFMLPTHCETQKKNILQVLVPKEIRLQTQSVSRWNGAAPLDRRSLKKCLFFIYK